MDLINIVRKIEKLEAGLSAVIGNDDDLMRKTREFYLSNTTLLITLDKCSKSHTKPNNKFTKFLDTKSRTEVIEQMQQEITDKIRLSIARIFIDKSYLQKLIAMQESTLLSSKNSTGAEGVTKKEDAAILRLRRSSEILSDSNDNSYTEEKIMSKSDENVVKNGQNIRSSSRSLG